MAARTPLYDRHVAAGARMVEFGGYDMPLQYSTIRDEHVAVRTRAGLFDLSHMGEVRVTGAAAPETVQHLLSNDIAPVPHGGALYSVMCNAACRAKDVAWMHDHAGAASLDDISDSTALLAVQGPQAVGIVQRLTPGDVGAIRPFHFAGGTVAGVHATISRTGYTGEDGFELYVDAAWAPGLWDSLLDAGSGVGLLPCGLGARDTLRLEAGLRLYGQDMDESTDPYSCGLGWTVKLQKGDFIGAGALQRLDPKQPPHRFVGLRLPEKTIARHGQPVLAADRPVGEVTSGTFSFTLGYGIATASVDPAAADGSLTVDIRGTAVAAERVPLPFYRRAKRD